MMPSRSGPGMGTRGSCVAPDNRRRFADLSDGLIKKRLDEILQALVAPIRKRRAELAQYPGFVLDVIREGTEPARVVTEATKKEVVEGLGLFAL
jgi:tryptophanyl-tRNA synthetase